MITLGFSHDLQALRKDLGCEAHHLGGMQLSSGTAMFVVF